MESKKSIIRLLRYKNVLYRLKSMGLVKVFSDNLGDAIGVVASQVRKDFSGFGITGSRRGGYNIEELITQINAIFGKDKMQNIVLVGVGNIGTALIRYEGFESEGMKIVAAFEVDESKVTHKGRVPILPLEELMPYVKKQGIRIAVAAVPDQAVPRVMEQLKSCGIKGVLNFSPVRVRDTSDFLVRNVNLVLELEHLIYHVNTLGTEKNS